MQCAMLKEVEGGNEWCCLCRKEKRKEKKEKKLEVKKEREERRERPEEQAQAQAPLQQQEQIEVDEEGDSEVEEETVESRTQRTKTVKVKAEKRPAAHEHPTISLPSSSSSSRAPSAPPSTRSLTSADPASAHVESFNELLAHFLDCFSPDVQTSIPYIDRDSASPLDWITLLSRLRLCAQKHVLAQVDVELLSRLLPFLLTSMEAATLSTLLQPHLPFDQERLQVLLKGLDGSLMALLILTQPGIERRLMREELLDQLVACVVRAVKKNILPLYDVSLRDKAGKEAEDDSAQQRSDDGDDDGEEREEEEDDEEATPAKKKAQGRRKKKPAQPSPAEVPAADTAWWKAAEGSMRDAVKKVELLLSLLERYIRTETTRDQHVLPLTELCFLVLSAEHCTRLQISTLPLLVAIFLQGDEARRSAVIDGVVTAFRASAQKKMQRSFSLQYPASSSFRSHFAPLATGVGGAAIAAGGGAKVQILVALVLQLIHSISASMARDAAMRAQHEQLLLQLVTASSPSSIPPPLVAEVKAFAERARDEYQGVQKACWYFVQSFLERLQPTATGSLQFKHTQAMVRAVLDDLLLLLFLPEWPAAEQLLHAFIVRMCKALDRPKAADKSGMHSDRFHLLCINSLGLVCQQVKAHDVQVQRAPMLIRPHRHIDNQQPATPHAASEVTDCICGYRLVGGSAWTPTEEGEETAAETGGAEVSGAAADALYLDCDSCHVWYHGVCVGFKSQEEVEAAGSWVCESCTLRMAVLQQKQSMESRIKGKTSADFSFALDEDAPPTPPDAVPEEAVSVSGAGGEVAIKASDLVLRQLLLNYLDELSSENVADAVASSRQFHLVQWIAAALKGEERHQAEAADASDTTSASSLFSSLSSTSELRLCLVNWSPPDAAPSSAADAPPTLSREGQFRLSRQLACSRELVLSLPLMLDKLLVKCTDPQPQFRAKAVTAVSGLVKVDPSILQHDSVRRALLERVMDPSTSTREAVLDLIGSQVQHQPSIFSEYYPTILERSNDVGISVRKRVVRLLQQFLLHPTLRTREDVQAAYPQMVTHLIDRLRDEETVQRLVRDTFYHLWFDPQEDAVANRRVSKAYVQQLGSSGDAVAGPTSSYTPGFQAIMRRIVESVVEVGGLHSGTDNLIDIVNHLIEREEGGAVKGKGKGKKKERANQEDAGGSTKSTHSIRSICADVCGCIVEQLVQQVDDAPADGVGPSVSYSSFLLSALSTLHFFSRLHPPFLTEHAYTLQPYLKHSLDKLLQPAVERLIDMFTEILPLIRHPTATFLTHMQADLSRVILQSTSLSLVASAIPCLVVLTSINGRADVLLALITRFHKFLTDNQPKTAMKAVPQEGNTIRCLLALGLLLKHIPEDEYAKLATATSPSIDAAFAVYERYIELCPVRVQIFGLKGLIALFTRKPTLITKSQAALTRALGVDVAPELQRSTLQSLRTFLQSEDARLQRAQKIDQQRTKVQRRKEKVGGGAIEEEGDAADAAEDEAAMVEELGAVHSMHDFHGKKRWLDSRIEVSDFLPALITLCEHHVYALCFSQHAMVRGEALAFTSVFLHQAVTNPADAMPTVVALLFDRSLEPANAAQALAMLQSLAEKKKEYQHFIEQRFLQGLRLGHALQLQVWSDDYDPLHRRGEDSSGVRYDSVSALYCLLKKSAAQRKHIAANLVNDLIAGQLSAASANPVLPSVATAAARSDPSQSPVPERSPSTPSDTRSSPASSPAWSPASSTTAVAAAADPSPSRAKFGFLCLVASLIMQLPFDDDEPLHYLHHCSKIINTRGTALLASLDDCVQQLQQMEEQLSDDVSTRLSLLPSIRERLEELSLLCDRAMSMSVLLHLRRSLTVAYQVDGRFDEWSIHTATAKAAVKLSKRSDVSFSFHHFPWRSDDDERRGSAALDLTEPDVSPTAKSPLKRTPTKAGGSGRKSAQHSRQASAAALTGLIPAQLLRQRDFFVELINEQPHVMQTTAPAGRGKGRARAKRSRAASDEEDSEVEELARPPSVSASATKAAAAAAPRGAAKKRRSLTFGHERLESSQTEMQEEEEDDDGDDEEWGEGDREEASSRTKRRKLKQRKGRGKGKVTAADPTQPRHPAFRCSAVFHPLTLRFPSRVPCVQSPIKA